uniref:Uncharacterized protein n=1 Tax=Solanum lycopersicum TaxID=4081 RepID=A0A3Q7I7D5_SOLLC
MATSLHLLPSILFGLLFLSAPTLSRNIIFLDDTPIAPSPSDDTTTSISPLGSGDIIILPSPQDSPIDEPVIPPSTGEIIISPSPQDLPVDAPVSPPSTGEDQSTPTPSPEVSSDAFQYIDDSFSFLML